MVSLGDSAEESEQIPKITIARGKAQITRQEWHRARRSARKQNKDAQAAATSKAIEDMVAGKYKVNSAVAKTVPFKIHRSHSAFYIGGFAFCASCAATEACGYSGHNLGKQCRKGAPSGSKAILKRMVSGQNPRGVKASWPDGSSQAMLERLSDNVFTDTEDATPRGTKRKAKEAR